MTSAAQNDAMQLLVAIGATLLGTSLASLLVRGRRFALVQFSLAIGALVAAFFTITSGTSPVARLSVLVRPPDLIIYGPVAFSISAMVLIYGERRRDRYLKALLLNLHTSLLDFAGEIALREAEIEGNGRSAAEGIGHDRWVTVEFERRYRPRFIELFRTLMTFGWFDAKTAVNLLQLPFREENRLYVGRTRIGIIARFVNGIADRPSTRGEWVKRWSAWGNLLTCFVLSAGTWFALEFLAKYWMPT